MSPERGIIIILYADLESGKRELDTPAPTTATLTVDDQRMIGKLRAVTQRVNNLFPARPPWPLFFPWMGTRSISINGYNTNSGANSLSFHDYLLELTSTSVNGTDVTDAVAYPDPNAPPFRTVRRSDGCMDWYSLCQSLCNSGPLQASLTGVWGFHSNFAEAWLAVDALQGSMDDSETSITVDDAAGTDIYGIAWRISIGNLIRIDQEYMEVVLVNRATNVVTVRRHANGSVAAAHLAGAVVYRWEVEPAVKNAVARQAAMQYSRIGAFTSVEVSAMGSEVRYPSDFLAEVLGTLQGYA